MLPRVLTCTALAALAILNVLISRWFVAEVRRYLVRRPPPDSHYTWIEDDVPERLTLTDPRPNVIMPLEESVRYGIDEPQSYLEWLYTATYGDMGYTRLGPNNRLFSVVLTHHMHCLRAFRTALTAEGLPEDVHHVEHCLSTLREFTLCAADATLEPGDPFARNYTVERAAGEQRCMDVEAFYGTMRKLWDGWLVSQSEVARRDEDIRQGQVDAA